MSKFKKYKEKFSGKTVIINVDGIESYTDLDYETGTVFEKIPVLQMKAGNTIVLDEKYTDFENDPDFKPTNTTP